MDFSRRRAGESDLRRSILISATFTGAGDVTRNRFVWLLTCSTSSREIDTGGVVSLVAMLPNTSVLNNRRRHAKATYATIADLVLVSNTTTHTKNSAATPPVDATIRSHSLDWRWCVRWTYVLAFCLCQCVHEACTFVCRWWCVCGANIAPFLQSVAATTFPLPTPSFSLHTFFYTET